MAEKTTIADLEVRISANTQALNQVPTTLNNLEKVIVRLDRSVKQLSKSMESGFAKSSDAVSKSTRSANTSISAQQKLLNRSKTILLQAKQKQLDLNAAVQKSKGDSLLLARNASSYKVLNDKIKAGVKDTSELALANQNFKKKLADVKRELNATTAAHVKASGSTKASVVSTERLGRATSQASIKVKDLVQQVGNTKKAKVAIKELKREFETYKRATAKANLTTAQFSKAQDKLNEALARTKRQTRAGSRTVTQFSKTIQIALGPLSGIASRLTAFAALTGTMPALVATLITGIIGLAVVLNKSIRAAAQFEKEFLRINAIIKATGKASEITAGQINKIAEELGDETLTNASKAREALAALLTLEEFPTGFIKDAGLAAQGLSLLGRGDIISNMRKLKRILEDPANSLKSLSDSGIFFNAVQENTIKRLQAQGDKFGALKVVMDALRPAIAAATEETGGLTGALDSLGETTTQVLESIGKKTLDFTGLTGLLRVANIILRQELKDLRKALGQEDPSNPKAPEQDGRSKSFEDSKIFTTATKALVEFRDQFLPLEKETIKLVDATKRFNKELNLFDKEMEQAAKRVDLTLADFKKLRFILENDLVTAAGKFQSSINNNIIIQEIERRAIKASGAEKAKLKDTIAALNAGMQSGILLNIKQANTTETINAADQERLRLIIATTKELEKQKRENAVSKQVEGLKQSLELLKREGNLIKSSQVARSRGLDELAAKQFLLNEGIEKGGDLFNEFVRLTNQISDEKITNFHKENIKGSIDALRIQKTIFKSVFLTTELFERQLLIKTKQLELENQFGRGNPRVQAELDLFIAIDRNVQKLKELRGVAETVEKGFEDTFLAVNKAIIEGENAFDAFKEAGINALKEIQKELVKTFLINPLKNALSTGLNSILQGALGGTTSGFGAPQGTFSNVDVIGANGFNQGPAFALAKGGVINTATMLSSRGRSGIAGESGPEAILPLARGRGGDLGVRTVLPLATGGGGRGGDITVVTPKITINVQNNASDDVEVSQEQTTSSGGSSQIDIIIDKMVAKNLRRTGGASNQAVRSLGGRTPLVSRG